MRKAITFLAEGLAIAVAVARDAISMSSTYGGEQ
jgi:hypothetical protein